MVGVEWGEGWGRFVGPGLPFMEPDIRFSVWQTTGRALLKGTNMRGLRSAKLVALGLGLVCGWPGDAGAGQSRPAGRLYLVGIGPGDPELMTFKAAKILKEADAVFCFEYVQKEVARWARPEVITVASPLLMLKFVDVHGKDLTPEFQEKVKKSKEEVARFAGKVRELIAEGKTVVLADGGDPTIYGPWSWIGGAFADLSPVFVPGLSSFNAGNAALKGGITPCPGALMITCGATLAEPDPDGRLGATVVLFTHRLQFEDAIARLASRYPADTPVAIVADASCEKETVIRGTIGTVEAKVRKAGMPGRYLIYAGDHLPKGK